MRFVLPALLCFVAITQASAAAMSPYQWKYRPVLVFSPSADNAALEQQRDDLKSNHAGYSERDIVLIWVVGDVVSSELGPKPGLSANALRQQYKVRPDEFKTVLVGKDGGVKMSAEKPLRSATLFKTVDAMPMRRDEMRK